MLSKKRRLGRKFPTAMPASVKKGHNVLNAPNLVTHSRFHVTRKVLWMRAKL